MLPPYQRNTGLAHRVQIGAETTVMQSDCPRYAANSAYGWHALYQIVWTHELDLPTARAMSGVADDEDWGPSAALCRERWLGAVCCDPQHSSNGRRASYLAEAGE